MQIFSAKERAQGGRYDYTMSNSSGTHPVGYCKAFKLLDPADPFWKSIYPTQAIREQQCSKYNTQVAPFKDKYHSNGHASAEEAYNCYREYQLDQELKLMLDPGVDAKTLHRCEGMSPTGFELVPCARFTRYQASLGNNRFFNLCELHNNRENVERLVPKATGAKKDMRGDHIVYEVQGK